LSFALALHPLNHETLHNVSLTCLGIALWAYRITGCSYRGAQLRQMLLNFQRTRRRVHSTAAHASHPLLLLLLLCTIAHPLPLHQ